MNDNKGYTLISMILTLMILAAMTTLLLKNNIKISTEHLSFINNYLSKQSIAIRDYQRIELEENNISFNKFGHVNGAKTINKGNHDLIIHLGNGYLTYE